MAKARLGFLIYSLPAGSLPAGKRREQGRADGGEVVSEGAWMVKLDWPLLSSLAHKPTMQPNHWREQPEAYGVQFSLGEKPVVAAKKGALEKKDHFRQRTPEAARD